MSNSFYGKYFDGKSSQPQIVEVIFDGGFEELKIRNENLKSVWLLRKISYENIGNFLEIRQKDNLQEFLTVEDNDFKQILIDYLRKNNKLSVYQKLIHLNLAKHLAVAAVVLAVIVIGYFFAVPYIAEKSVALIPVTFDKKIGDAFMGDFILGNKQDSVKTLLLNEFADEMNLNNVQKLHFRVIKSETINAFALPNGEIVVYSGILEKMSDYTELAGLIGHETTHINNRHTMKMLCKNLAGYIVISALFADVNGMVAVIAENAHNLNALSYSRSFETEADEQAVNLMLENEINPQGVISLFEILKKEANNSGEFKILEYMQTHPLTDNRIKNIQQIIDKQEFTPKDNQKMKLIFEKLVKK